MDSDTNYDFEWDPAKALSNARKHDVTFDRAASIFLDALALTVLDQANSQDEERWFTVGYDTGGQLLAVAHVSVDRTYQCSGSHHFCAQGNETRAQRLRGRTAIGQHMTVAATSGSDDRDMPDEIDFIGGARGQFHRPNLKLNLPVYLDADVQAYLTAVAARKGVPLSELANELLKKEIAILEAVK
jgi:uncharacterized DUF497 family protein